MNYTPTPRSDAAELTEPYEIRALGFCVVHIDEARKLERELAEWIKKASQYAGINVGLNLDLHLAKGEIMDIKQQRDRLAEALRMCQREMLDVLRDLHDDRQPFDGDDFHAALEKTEEALATLDQPEPWGRMIL